MPNTQQSVTLTVTLPEHVSAILSSWAPSELGCTPEDVLETLAEELCRNEALRRYVGRLITDL
jgi:hypothetical protein